MRLTPDQLWTRAIFSRTLNPVVNRVTSEKGVQHFHPRDLTRAAALAHDCLLSAQPRSAEPIHAAR